MINKEKTRLKVSTRHFGTFLLDALSIGIAVYVLVHDVIKWNKEVDNY